MSPPCLAVEIRTGGHGENMRPVEADAPEPPQVGDGDLEHSVESQVNVARDGTADHQCQVDFAVDNPPRPRRRRKRRRCRHCARPRMPTPGVASTSAPSLTTATPFTSTNRMPSEYCAAFSYVDRSRTRAGSKTTRSASASTRIRPLSFMAGAYRS